MRVLCQIDLHGFYAGFRPLMPQFRHRLIHALLVVVPDGDPCTRVQQALHNRQAQTAGAAGHHRVATLHI